MRLTGRPGAALAAALAVVVTSALLPAGLGGTQVRLGSVLWWAAVLTVSLFVVASMRGSFVTALRGMVWLSPSVVLLTLPAAALAVEGRRMEVALALTLRACAAAAAAWATFTTLGPTGLVAGLRALHVPARLVEIVHAMLVSLTAIVRQVTSMLRARTARRVSRAPWAALAVAPIATVRGFGRLAGALLLRSVERAEALERARWARGGIDE